MDFTPGEWCNNIYGQHPPLDVDKLAFSAGLNLTAQFIIRFQQRGEDDFTGPSPTAGDGIFLDDLEVTGLLTTSTTVLPENNLIKIFPVPCVDELNMNFTDLNSKVEDIKLYNYLGKIISQKEIQN